MTSQKLLFKEISMNNIIISDFNVRKNLEAGSEDSNIEDLAKSINEKGLLNPIDPVNPRPIILLAFLTFFTLSTSKGSLQTIDLTFVF